MTLAIPSHAQNTGSTDSLESCAQPRVTKRADKRTPLYTPEQRERRNRSGWTLVQGILAPLQFVVFLVSLVLLVRYLNSEQGFAVAAASVVVKTIFLYAIMITGALWEHAVFGRYLFAPAFFWEDVVSMLVMFLHTLYVALYAWLYLFADAAQHIEFAGYGLQELLILVALAAYISYVINAAQFVLKLRQARLSEAH